MNLLLLCGQFAYANSIDTFGFGAKSMSRGMGGVALNLGTESYSINPAAASGSFESIFGLVSVRSQFSDLPPVAWDTNRDGMISDDDAPLLPGAHSPSVDLFVLGVAGALTKRISWGINCIVPTTRYFRVTTYEPSLPVWVMYRNRAERFDIRVGAGAEVWRGLRLGWGGMIGYAADLKLSGTLGVASISGPEESEATNMALDLDIHEMEMAFNPRFVPSLSAFWDLGQLHQLFKGTSIGLNYRFESSMPLRADLDFQINLSLEDVGDLSPMSLAVVAPLQLDIHDQFIPGQLTFGAAWGNDTFSLNADLKYTQWSSMNLHVIELVAHDVQAPLGGIDFEITNGNEHELTLKDTLAFSFGANSDLPFQAFGWGFDASVGGGFTPNALGKIGKNISPLDANRATYSMGFNSRRRVQSISKRVSLSFFGQLHHLLTAELQVDYDTALTPGAPIDTNAIPIGGLIGALGMQLTLGDL